MVRVDDPHIETELTIKEFWEPFDMNNLKASRVLRLTRQGVAGFFVSARQLICCDSK